MGSMTALVARGPELATLRACVDAAGDGAGSLALVEGVAGIGKTRLLEEALAHARELGAVVLFASAEELELARPFGPLAGALTASGVVSPAIAEAVTAASEHAGRDGTGQFQVIADLLDHLETLATSAPLVVALDDLQWADPATLMAIQALLERRDSLPAAILVTLRPVPRSRQVDRVIEGLIRHDAAHLRLDPLAGDEVVSLLADAVHAEPGASLKAQAGRAGGNPFYLHELLRTLMDEQAIEVRDGRAEVTDTAYPATLGSTILRHLRFLDPETLELLELAAVLGTRFGADDLASVSRRRIEELIGPLRQGVEAGVLHDRPGGFAFRHDLVREALYRRLPKGLRNQLHRTAGQALAANGAPSSKVATHLAIGAQPGDRDAIRELRRAAVDLSMAAPDIAEDFARRAIELALPTDPEHDALRADLVTLLVASGQATAAHDLAHEMLDAPHDDEVEGRVRFALGQASFLVGDLTTATEQMELAARHPSLSPAEQSLALAEAGMVRLLASGDLAGAEADATEALATARAAEDRVGESMAMCVLAGVEQFRGNVAAALEAVEHAATVGAGPAPTEPGGLTSALRDPHMFHGMALLDADEVDTAVEAFRAGARVSADRGVAGRGHFYHYWTGYRHFLAGDWDDCVAEFETGLQVAEEIDNRRGTLAVHALLGLVAFHRDEMADAAAHVERSERQLAADGPDFGIEWMTYARALLTDAAGDPDAARDLLAGIWEGLNALGSRFHYRTIGTCLTRLALASGKRQLATVVTKALEEFAEQEPFATIRGAALHCRGLVEEREEPLLEAAATLRGGPRPLPLAAALEDAADLVARAPDRHDQARQLFSEANELYRELGAERDMARLLARMRGAGIRAGVRGARRRPDLGWDSLTPTELRVAALVGEGLSNPQIGERLFVSRRTVQTHVSNIFRKLSLASRTELAAELARQEAPDPPTELAADMD